MTQMTDYLEAALLNHVFRNTAMTSPTTVYAVLCSADPTDAATGAACSEIANSGAYARTAIAFGAPGATNGQITNTVCTFPTATGSWGTISHFVIADSGTYGAGNALMYGPLTVSKTVNTGDVFQFPAGQVTITFS